MKLNVEGMTCGHCVRTIEQAVARLGGRARVDLATATVEVVGIEDRAAVQAALADAGYRVVESAPGRAGGCCGPRET